MKAPEKKPLVVLIGKDSNSFAILGRVSKALKKVGADQEYIDRYFSEATAGNWDHLLQVTAEYVHVG